MPFCKNDCLKNAYVSRIKRIEYFLLAFSYYFCKIFYGFIY